LIIYPSLKNALVQHKNKFIWLIFIIIGISTLPNPVKEFGPGLDPSGLIALSWIALKNLQFGHDIIWSFGPLGYFYTTTFVYPSLWFPPVIYHLFVHSFFIFSIALLTIRLSIKWKDNLFVILLMVPLVFITSYRGNQDDQLIFSFIIILYLIITNRIGRKYETIILFFVASLLAFESLIKLNMAVASLSVIIIFSSISIFMKESKRALVFSASYIFLVPIFWIMSGQQLTNLPSFASNVLEASSGYNYGLAIEGPLYQVYAGVIGVVFVIILFIYSVVKKHKNLIIFILLNSILLFMAFKHGFVRHDLHVMNYLFTYGVFFLSSYIIFKYDTKRIAPDKKRILLLSLLFVGAILYVVAMDVIWPGPTLPDITTTIPAWGEVYPLIFDESYQIQKTESKKNGLRDFHQLDKETVDFIGNKTMDVIPWDFSVPWSYDFNWSPRPLVVSFIVFSAHLDKLNAQHFLDDEAPEIITYSYKSVDGRYPLFDEPLTFKAILENYQLVNTSGEFALLSHSPKERILGMEEDLGITEVKFGEPIKIPKYDKGYVFADIELELSPYGKILNAAFRPANSFVAFNISDESYTQKYRLPRLSNEGVFVSHYVYNLDEFTKLFANEITQNVDEMIFFVADSAQYENNVRVKFVGVPANISVKEVKPIDVPKWNSLKLVDGGLFTIDRIGSGPYHQGNDDIIDTNELGLPFIYIAGWAVDNLAEEGDVNTFLVFRDGENEITFSTRKVPRPDLVTHFGVDSYYNGGWNTIIYSEEFEKECYTLSLRIQRSNGQEYFELDGERLICFK